MGESRSKVPAMSHPLVLAVFDDPDAAARGARSVRALGIAPADVSVVARTHDEEGELAEKLGGSPGAEIEDSRLAGRLGELGAHLLAAIAVVMPGIGPIVADGPLAASLGEAAGHAAGSVDDVLVDAGVDRERARAIAADVRGGAVLLGIHVASGSVDAVRDALTSSGARDVIEATWRRGGTTQA